MNLQPANNIATQAPVKQVASVPVDEINIRVGKTRGDFTVTVNGENLPNVSGIDMYAYRDDYGGGISLGISIAEPNPQPGSLAERRYLTFCPAPVPAPGAAATQQTADQKPMLQAGEPTERLKPRATTNDYAQIANGK